jgi:outer membrane receptor for ferrienterochelin and colicin
MHLLFRRGFILSCLVLLAFTSYSQNLDSLLNLNAFTDESELQKILNKNVSVSSRKALTTRETPGIISLITAEEIQNAGSRDLIDVLRLVPGFEVLQDNQFVMGLGIRGNWANEGKVLVLMDGHYMNELLYQTVSLGNHFPVDAIERIEIIRGPGSAIYGGSAEYGVINIITKAAEDLHGVKVYGAAGLHSNAVGRTNAGVMAAQHFEKFAWDLSLFKGKGTVSDGPFESLYGDYSVTDLSKATEANPLNINAGLRIKDLSVRAMYDEFHTTDPVSFADHKNFFGDIRYNARVTSKLTITPSFRYYNQIPWSFGSKVPFEYSLRTRAERMWGQIEASYDVNRKVNLHFGSLYFADKGTDLLTGDYFSGNKSFTMNNYAVFAQALFKHRLANATLGFRYERNNVYGSAFVPRFALTKKIENFHFKALYSRAFRAPSILNVTEALTGDIKPEKSNALEMELGYQFTPVMLLSLNAFSLTTQDVIIYGSAGEGDTFDEWYENYLKSGTRGVELVYSIRKSRWYANASYAYNQAISDNTVEKYAVPQTLKQYIGFPASKFLVNASVRLFKEFHINSTLIYSSKRYGYTSLNSADEPVVNELAPYLIANLFVNYKNVLPGMTLGAGVFDLLNERPAIPQAYNGDYAPIPGRSREFVLKLSYQLDFKK